MITCNNGQSQYVVQTKQPVSKRMNSHRFDIHTFTDPSFSSYVASHFNSPDHTNRNLSFMPIDVITNDIIDHATGPSIECFFEKKNEWKKIVITILYKGIYELKRRILYFRFMKSSFFISYFKLYSFNGSHLNFNSPKFKRNQILIKKL